MPLHALASVALLHAHAHPAAEFAADARITLPPWNIADDDHLDYKSPHDQLRFDVQDTSPHMPLWRLSVQDVPAGVVADVGMSAERRPSIFLRGSPEALTTVASGILAELTNATCGAVVGVRVTATDMGGAHPESLRSSVELRIALALQLIDAFPGGSDAPHVSTARCALRAARRSQAGSLGANAVGAS